MSTDVPSRVKRVALRIAAAIEAKPRLALTIIALVLALAARGAPPAQADVAELCVDVIGAAVGP